MYVVGGLQWVQDHLIAAPGHGHGPCGDDRRARCEHFAHAIHHSVHAAQCLLQVGEVQVLLHDLLLVAHVLALLPFPDVTFHYMAWHGIMAWKKEDWRWALDLSEWSTMALIIVHTYMHTPTPTYIHTYMQHTFTAFTSCFTFQLSSQHLVLYDKYNVL